MISICYRHTINDSYFDYSFCSVDRTLVISLHCIPLYILVHFRVRKEASIDITPVENDTIISPPADFESELQSQRPTVSKCWSRIDSFWLARLRWKVLDEVWYDLILVLGLISNWYPKSISHQTKKEQCKTSSFHRKKENVIIRIDFFSFYCLIIWSLVLQQPGMLIVYWTVWLKKSEETCAFRNITRGLSDNPWSDAVIVPTSSKLQSLCDSKTKTTNTWMKEVWANHSNTLNSLMTKHVTIKDDLWRHQNQTDWMCFAEWLLGT